MSEPRTLTELYFSAIDQFGRRPVALRSRLTGPWVDLSYAELAHYRVAGTSAIPRLDEVLDAASSGGEGVERAVDLGRVVAEQRVEVVLGLGPWRHERHRRRTHAG